MARPIRIVCYAVNGRGVGHLTRLTALARWMRRYALYAGVRPEILFLTTSEADGALFHEGFASFKVPSKTAAHDGGLDRATHLALAKQWVWHSVALYRPDLLVVDTFPRGSFGELGSCLDLCKKRAFVYRPVKDEVASRPDFQAMLPLYDLLLVPEEQIDLPMPPTVVPRARAIGQVASRELGEIESRAEARRLLAIPDDAFVVFASGGGGGDPGADADLRTIADALAGAPGTWVIVAAGPLSRSRPMFGPTIRFMTSLGAAALMRAADVAVCAAGYNTFAELMIAGVPSIFVPQEKAADEQHKRALRAEEKGAAMVLERPLTQERVRAAVDRFRDESLRTRASEAARSFTRANGARAGARALLELLLPISEVDAAVKAVSDPVIEASRALAIPEGTFLHAMHLLDPAPEGLPAAHPEAAGVESVRMLRALASRGLATPPALRAAAAFLRRLEAGSPGERGAACQEVMEALGGFGDWAGAAALIKLTPWDPTLDPGAIAAYLTSIARDLTTAGEDLYRGIARVLKPLPAPIPSGQVISGAADEANRDEGAADDQEAPSDPDPMEAR